jgi:hypothetical protein
MVPEYRSELFLTFFYSISETPTDTGEPLVELAPVGSGSLEEALHLVVVVHGPAQSSFARARLVSAAAA